MLPYFPGSATIWAIIFSESAFELFPLTESLVGAKVPRVKENKFLPGGA
jgi:hypothetical protein